MRNSQSGPAAVISNGTDRPTIASEGVSIESETRRSNQAGRMNDQTNVAAKTLTITVSHPDPVVRDATKKARLSSTMTATDRVARNRITQGASARKTKLPPQCLGQWEGQVRRSVSGDGRAPKGPPVLRRLV